MHDGGSRLVIFPLRDPHLLESGQAGENGSTNPHRVLALWRSNHLDLHGRRRQSGELLRHTLANAGKHGGASREHHVAIQVLANVNIALHDGLESRVMDTAGLLANKAWLEEDFRAAEALT